MNVIVQHSLHANARALDANIIFTEEVKKVFQIHVKMIPQFWREDKGGVGQFDGALDFSP